MPKFNIVKAAAVVNEDGTTTHYTNASKAPVELTEKQAKLLGDRVEPVEKPKADAEPAKTAEPKK